MGTAARTWRSLDSPEVKQERDTAGCIKCHLGMETGHTATHLTHDDNIEHLFYKSISILLLMDMHATICLYLSPGERYRHRREIQSISWREYRHTVACMSIGRQLERETETETGRGGEIER